MGRFLGKLSFSHENYGYLNACLRGRVSRLFKTDDYETIARGDLKAFEQFLLESPYAESFRQKLVTLRSGTLRRIESAIAREVSLQLRFLGDTAQGEAKDLLGVILARSDLMNGRLLLRALYTDSKHGEEPQWHDYGNLSANFYSDIWQNTATATDIISRCRIQAHPYALALGSSFVELERTKDLMKAERVLLTSMLKLFQENVNKYSSSNSTILCEYLGRSIDMWNLGIWLRQRSGFIPSETALKLYLQNGQWLTIKKLSQATVLMELVHQTPWQAIIRAIENSTPQEFQRALFVQFIKWQADLFRANPLGVEVGMGYIAKYIIEWQNLNLLSVGLSMGLPEKELLSRLIPV